MDSFKTELNQNQIQRSISEGIDRQSLVKTESGHAQKNEKFKCKICMCKGSFCKDPVKTDLLVKIVLIWGVKINYFEVQTEEKDN